ncbi:LysM peptidoglycan-binding domain-containing protein [Agromyces sp. ISL-38]|uniref:LysM peptidoglycan-binding domain-containing protein n=1 Tax=Agromyces sp. ISL-38 TaxID=2819107 RepID=UPI001BE7659E|nr:LysM peptidoglycan-binding domain-containing protein [Agromyces sp. ISL-38]MBT2500450.1 LysM peptidoglycan-binding domain-containing protein [Agromyces sp. ISL-38]MBT2519192.1 LysM peptidoglycan-binding domain-containing protein [Streptomyces sp. ISL-90]
MSATIVTTGFSTAALPRQGAPSPAGGQAHARLRLTRRGRIVFTTLAAVPVVVWALATILGAGGAAAEVDGAGAMFEYVTIDQGDSLWAIAESIAPNGDPRVVIDEIIRLNGLDGAVVEPGQRLALPIVR